jgi:hypothetical protein
VKFNFRQYVVSSYLAPILSSIPFLACCVLIESWFPAANLAGFITRVIILMPFYLVPVWYLSIRKQERVGYIGAFCKLMPVLSRKLGLLA